MVERRDSRIELSLRDVVLSAKFSVSRPQRTAEAERQRESSRNYNVSDIQSGLKRAILRINPQWA